MPKAHIEGLITQLNDQIGDSTTSPEQERLFAQMQSQLTGWEGPSLDNDLRDTAELLVNEWEEEHPTLAAIVKDIVETLHNAGL